MLHKATNSDSASNEAQEDATTGEPVAALSDAQVRGLLALLSEPTLQDAAKSIEVNPSTLWRWQQQPAFAEAYRVARREAVTRAIARLQHATGEAVKALCDVMKETGPGSSAPRVSAARVVLEFAIKGTELEDLAGRVAELERIEAQRTERRKV